MRVLASILVCGCLFGAVVGCNTGASKSVETPANPEPAPKGKAKEKSLNTKAAPPVTGAQQPKK